jgi:serine-type D-Ala-D-Ala carboxypeptidase/endopeptidase (penicillin-binding protein 4)
MGHGGEPQPLRRPQRLPRQATPSTFDLLPSKFLLFTALAFLLASPVAAQSLTQRLDRALDAPPLDRHLWGIAVSDTSGRRLFGRNADRLFIPASNAKLVVSAAAAVLLRPDFTVATSVYGAGPVEDGVLQGHLVLYGRGDPTMGKRCYDADTTLADVCVHDAFGPLRALATSLRDRGIRTVAGDLVGDGSWFDGPLLHPTWEHSDLTWWYAAPVSGLGFTDNSLELQATPTTEGAPAFLTLWPELGDVAVENRTRTVPPDRPRTLDVLREHLPGGVMRLIVTGDVPLDVASRTEYVAVVDPDLYAARAFRQVLAEEGIAVLGGTWSTRDSTLFHQARSAPALAEVTSRPLSDWLFPILNTSQNWFAEMLTKQLGRRHGAAGSWTEGLAVARRFLIDSAGVDSTQAHLSDGSGLSAVNLITPAALVRLLTWMRTHPRYDVFVRGMPVSGQRGSLRTRFVETPLAGRVAAKSGSIGRVNTLSGYIERPRGGPLVFSIQANHHTLGGRVMIAAIDSVVVLLGRP